MARLAGLYPAGALMEIMNEDGTMARLPELRRMADEFGLKLISIRDLIAYRLKQESIAFFAASLMWSGVLKSGSHTLRLITSTP